MLFVPKNSREPRQGRLLRDHPDGGGVPLVIDEEGQPWSPERVAWVLPDDEHMALEAQLGGYDTHTPISVTLGTVVSRGTPVP